MERRLLKIHNEYTGDMTNSVRERIYWPCSVEYVPSKNCYFVGKGNLKVIFSDNCLRRMAPLKECQARPTPSYHTRTHCIFCRRYFQRLAQCLAQVDAHKFNNSTNSGLKENEERNPSLQTKSKQRNLSYGSARYSSMGRRWFIQGQTMKGTSATQTGNINATFPAPSTSRNPGFVPSLGYVGNMTADTWARG